MQCENIYLISKQLWLNWEKRLLLKRKANPFDEAVSLIWYLEMCYQTSGDCFITCKKNFQFLIYKNPLIKLGFFGLVEIVMVILCDY
jgi:phosphoenolpyruvate carboxylase